MSIERAKLKRMAALAKLRHLRKLSLSGRRAVHARDLATSRENRQAAAAYLDGELADNLLAAQAMKSIERNAENENSSLSAMSELELEIASLHQSQSGLEKRTEAISSLSEGRKEQDRMLDSILLSMSIRTSGSR